MHAMIIVESDMVLHFEQYDGGSIPERGWGGGGGGGDGGCQVAPLLEGIIALG